MKWWNLCLPLSGLGFRKVFLEEFFYHLILCSQTISLEGVEPSLCFTGQGKWEEVESNGILRNFDYLDCVTYFYVCGQVSIRVFIMQTMKEVVLDQLDELIWIGNIGHLYLHPYNTSKALWCCRARVIFKCHSKWSFFRHLRLLKDRRRNGHCWFLQTKWMSRRWWGGRGSFFSLPSLDLLLLLFLRKALFFQQTASISRLSGTRSSSEVLPRIQK